MRIVTLTVVNIEWWAQTFFMYVTYIYDVKRVILFIFLGIHFMFVKKHPKCSCILSLLHTDNLLATFTILNLIYISNL